MEQVLMLISSRCMCEVGFVVDQEAEQVCGSFQANNFLTLNVSRIHIILTVNVSIIIHLHVVLSTLYTHTHTHMHM